ncbi:MAG: DUF4270 family protein [Crocinitomicaceae bacterium]|nr:DUF4270 family protein [Crocinitomicaceae bacterium]
MTNNKISIISKRRVVQLSATFFISLFVLWSCRKEETDVGQSLQGEGLDVTTIDTFSLITYTDELTPMPSDETAINLLGYYRDPVFGSVDCGIVTQVRLSSSNPSFSASPGDVIVDSVVMSLAYTGIKWYGNLDDITVEAYEITDDLIREDQQYHTSTTPNYIATNLVPIGEEVISPDVVSDVPLANGDTLAAHLRIRLDSTLLGDKLVSINEAGNMATDELFVNAFKGIYLKVNGSGLAVGQGGVLYFALESSLSKLTLYFHEVSDPTLKEYDFPINSSAARYNKIDFGRAGTDVEAVLTDSTQGQDQFYTQAGSAWAIVHIPHIMDLNKDSLGDENKKIINKAELVLPVQDFEQDGFDPSTRLFIARVINDSISDFTRDYQSINALPIYDQANKEFRFIMTLEIQGILNGTVANNGFRIYTTSFFASSIERTIFNGPESTLKDKARLEVTYTDY